MERRVVFGGWVCPAILLLPQMAVTIVFFFWPAGQAVVQSFLRGDAFGLSEHFAGADNFATLLADPNYLASFGITALASACPSSSAGRCARRRFRRALPPGRHAP